MGQTEHFCDNLGVGNEWRRELLQNTDWFIEGLRRGGYLLRIELGEEFLRFAVRTANLYKLLILNWVKHVCGELRFGSFLAWWARPSISPTTFRTGTKGDPSFCRSPIASSKGLRRDGCLLRIELGEEFFRFAFRSDYLYKLLILN